MRLINFNSYLKVKIYEDIDKLNCDLSSILKNEIQKGLCIIPGGTTPKNIYEKLSNLNLKKKIKILLSDDRLVDNFNELSNYKMLMDTLKLNYYKEFPLSYYDELINNGEGKLQKKLSLILKKNPINLSLLGIGSDGHTASIFPDNTNFDSNLHSFKTINKNEKFHRYSLSFKTLMKSNKIIFLATGFEKNKPLKSFFTNNLDFIKYPFQKLAFEHSNVEFYCDSKAFKDINL